MYSAYGLVLASDVPLPELIAAPEGATSDVTVRHGSLPVPPEDEDFDERFIRYENDEAYFFWRTLGAFLVRPDEVIYDLIPGASLDTMRLPLLGICMGTLLHQRKVLTLHASAVVVEGQAIAFIGWKGMGKSTTAGAMHSSGHVLLTDDVLALDVDKRYVNIRPGFPQIKLKEDSAASIGHDTEELKRVAPDVGKFVLRDQLAFSQESIPLSAVYILGFGESLSARRLSGQEAFLAVMSQTFATRFAGTGGTDSSYFSQITTLLGRVPIFSLQRKADLSGLDDLVSFLEDHVRSL